jgi:aspartate/methionine/tyrosine aminotransferase
MNLPPFQLERYFAQHEFSSSYLLCSSDLESVTVGDLLALEADATERLHELWLGYTETTGDPALRAEIATIYETISPEQVLVHAGAEEAIFNFMQVMLEPGDHVIVQWPGYQSLAEVARSIGCDVTLWRMRFDGKWSLDTDDLSSYIKPNTRAVVVNSPHNPTGYLAGRDSLDTLINLAESHGLTIFSDEVYRGLEHDPADEQPALCDLSEQAVSLGVMSKTYGMAGLRIGWIATRNQAIYEAMASFKDYTTICNSAPSELLATIALRHRDGIVARNLDLIRHNLDLLDASFAAHSDRFEWHRPKAGPIAFPKLAGGARAAPFCAQLVEQAGVLLLPGDLIDPAAASHFRIGFGRRNMPDALEQLSGWLDQP